MDDLAASVRATLKDVFGVHEVKMFGGTGFMLNGNLLVAASKRGLLARIGKDAQAEALARPGTRLMEMRDRPMPGYVFVDPDALTPSGIADWIALARAFVATLPRKEKSTSKGGKR